METDVLKTFENSEATHRIVTSNPAAGASFAIPATLSPTMAKRFEKVEESFAEEKTAGSETVVSKPIVSKPVVSVKPAFSKKLINQKAANVSVKARILAKTRKY